MTSHSHQPEGRAAAPSVAVTMRSAIVCVLWTLAARAAADPPAPAAGSALLPTDLRCLQYGPQCAAVEAALPLAQRRLDRLLGAGAARRLGGERRLRQAGLHLVLPCCGADEAPPPPSSAELAERLVGALVPALRPLPGRHAADPAQLAAAAELITVSTASCYSVSSQQLLVAWQAFVNLAIGASTNTKSAPGTGGDQLDGGDLSSQRETEDFLVNVQRFCVLESRRRPTFSLPHWIEFLEMLPRLQQLPRCGAPFHVPRTVGEPPQTTAAVRAHRQTPSGDGWL